MFRLNGVSGRGTARAPWRRADQSARKRGKLGPRRGRWRRWLLAAVGAVLVAALAGVVAGHGAVADRHARPRLQRLERLVPPPPETLFYPLGEQLHVQGVDRQMAYGLTRASVHKVVARYEGIWRSQGLSVRRQRVPTASGDAELWVFGYHADDPWLRTVMATPKHSGSLVVASIAPAGLQSGPPRVPMPGACSAVSHTGALDGDRRTEMALLDCSAAPRDVMGFYRGLLGSPSKRRQLHTPEGRDGLWASFARDGRRVELSVVQIKRSADARAPELRSAAAVHWQQEQP